MDGGMEGGRMGVGVRVGGMGGGTEHTGRKAPLDNLRLPADEIRHVHRHPTHRLAHPLQEFGVLGLRLMFSRVDRLRVGWLNGLSFITSTGACARAPSPLPPCSPPVGRVWGLIGISV